MTLPLLNAIRKNHPNAHITWICGKRPASLLEATQLIDHIVQVNEEILFKGNFVRKIGEVLKVWRSLRGHLFDLCLTLHPDRRYQLLSGPLRIKTRKTIQKKELISGKYHASVYKELFSKIPETEPLSFPSLYLPKSCALLESIFDSLSAKLYIAVAPGGAKNACRDDALRRWPIAYYAKLVESLQSPHIAWIVIGSDSDRWILPYFRGLSFQDLVGKLSLLELILLSQKCDLLITHDSGPLHLAKLANCPTLALFGPTNPYEKIGLEEPITLLWGGEFLACRPCYDGKSYANCQKNECLHGITPEIARRALLERISHPCKILDFLFMFQGSSFR